MYDEHMTELFTAISNFGFPVVVAAYLLFRFETKLEKLDDSISGATGLIVQLKDLKTSVDHLARRVDNNSNGK